MRNKFLLVLLVLFSCTFAREDPKICLTMVVKNDEDVIWRCLSSVEEFVDYISICDAGSSDRTLILVERFLQETGIPGKVHRSPYNDIEKSRSFAIEATQSMLKTSRFSFLNTYLLVLDPNKKLEVDPFFKKSELRADAYLLFEKLPSFSRYNARLLLASGIWNGSDIAYEQDVYREPEGALKLNGLTVASSRYFAEREIVRIDQAVEEHPENLYSLFYLAQLHKSLKQYDDAIAGYLHRISKGGNLEEIWFSKYMLGECYEEIGQWDRALFWYLDAYQTCPDRAETIGKVASYYRHTGQNDLAYLFAKHGAMIPDFDRQRLFDTHIFNNYQFEVDLSVSSYYTRFKEEGLFAAHNILTRRDTPWWVKEHAARNILFYTKNIEAERYPIEIDLPVVVSTGEHYYPMNPSIVKTDDGYTLICRSVNYTQTGAKTFHTTSSDGVFRTRNFLCSLSADFTLLSQSEIQEFDAPERTQIISFVDGMEDCRLFAFANSHWFTCTQRDLSPSGVPQIILYQLADTGCEKETSLKTCTLLQGPDPNRCEKNWLPFVQNGIFRVIYSYDPLIVYEPDVQTGECKTVICHQPAQDFSRFRGSAGPIEFDEGYLILVHEVAMLENESRVYLHRFLYLDADFSFKKISMPFTFEHQGIEFCCSMSWDHSGKKIVMPLGIEDHDAFLYVIDVDIVRSLLHSL